MYPMHLGVVVLIFVLYYLAVLIFNKRLVTNPSEIVSKFFTSVLAYLGLILIYSAFTGRMILEDILSFQIYIFITGFVILMTAIPNILKDFSVFKRLIFTRRRSDRRR